MIRSNRISVQSINSTDTQPIDSKELSTRITELEMVNRCLQSENSILKTRLKTLERKLKIHNISLPIFV